MRIDMWVDMRIDMCTDMSHRHAGCHWHVSKQVFLFFFLVFNDVTTHACHMSYTRIFTPRLRRSVLGTHPWSIGEGMFQVIGPKTVGHNYIGHNFIGHNYIGHNYIGHFYIGHNYIPMVDRRGTVPSRRPRDSTQRPSTWP